MTELLKLDNKTQIKHWQTINIDKDPLKSRALWQGATYAEDPRSGGKYLYQMQAVPVKGDVEDIWVHVFEITSTGNRYLWSSELPAVGHAQSLHVRISIAGRHWCWMGVDEFENFKAVRTYIWRFELTSGKVLVDHSNSRASKIHTGTGGVHVIGCFDGSSQYPDQWTVVLRRPSKDYETYEWHDETMLRTWLPGNERPKPYASIRVQKLGGTYQSACATGTHLNAERLGRIYRIAGATEERTRVYRYKVALPSQNGRDGGLIKIPDAIWDITDYAPDSARPVSSEEGEAIFIGPNNVVTAGKRWNSVNRRVVGYGRITGLK